MEYKKGILWVIHAWEVQHKQARNPCKRTAAQHVESYYESCCWNIIIFFAAEASLTWGVWRLDHGVSEWVNYRSEYSYCAGLKINFIFSIFLFVLSSLNFFRASLSLSTATIKLPFFIFLLFYNKNVRNPSNNKIITLYIYIFGRIILILIQE